MASIRLDRNVSFTARVLRGDGVALAPGLRYALAALVFSAALFARFAMLPLESGLGFLTFYPAVALTALMFGTGPAALVIALGAVAAHYFFMPPYWAFKLRLDHMLSVATYCLSGAIVCYMTQQLHRHSQQLKQTLNALERREDELAKANQRLESLDRAKTEFFANISHEFRTPLTLILGPLESLLTHPPEEQPEDLPEWVSDQLKVVRRNAQRLLRLVNTLLDFSKIEAGKAQPNWEAVELASYTAELASGFQSAFESGGVQLRVDCPPLPRTVVVDRGMWEKVVLNLLSNAFKFTFQGAIQVSMSYGANEVILTVRDTGTGMPPQELPLIFNRFHRVQGARGRSLEGSGIGLALTADLVKLHGGTITVDSEEGQGSTFTVRLPFGHERLGAGSAAVAGDVHHDVSGDEVAGFLGWVSDATVGASIGAQRPVVPAATRGRIVLADDNPDMRHYVRGLLEAAGYEVDAVDNGEAALARCHAQAPELVLTDVMMQGLDGFGVLERLRKDPNTATLPVILLSARAGEEARVEGLSAGADDYIVKPFGARELVARIDGVFKLAHLRRDAQQKVAHYMAELERSNQSLLDFAHVVSHDLKEPLRGLHNYASILKEDYGASLDDEGVDYLDRMQRLVERLATLVDGLLSYSRLGASSMHIEPVLLDRLLDDVVEDLRPFLTGQSVTVVRPAPLPTVPCDALLVREIFQNLITNAAKYNDKPERWVEIGCNPSVPAIFYVRDNGIGMAVQHHGNIFRIFKRLHERDKFGGGTGVGLSIVKKLVERHGGRIWLESTPDVGTTFYFTLDVTTLPNRCP